MTIQTSANADEEILTIVLKAPKDWVDALDQWRETRGNVLHLGKPSRPASIRYLVRLGMAADAEAAKPEAKPRTWKGRRTA